MRPSTRPPDEHEENVKWILLEQSHERFPYKIGAQKRAVEIHAKRDDGFLFDGRRRMQSSAEIIRRRRLDEQRESEGGGRAGGAQSPSYARIFPAMEPRRAG